MESYGWCDRGDLQRRDPPNRLYMSILPEYVPKTRGTFMVNAQVRKGDQIPVPIQCAVHYVQVDRGVRYRVQPAGTGLSMPSDATPAEVATVFEPLSRTGKQVRMRSSGRPF